MSKRSRLLVAGAAGLLLAVLPTFAKTPPETKPKAAPVETAVIENSGSTNTTGYRFEISSVGLVTILQNSGGTVSYVILGKRNYADKSLLNLNAKLFQDLNAAMPLSSLPVRHGMRSASFGTQTYITYKGQRSPDLTFASDPRTAALKADIDSITKALHVGNAPRHIIVIHADR